MATAVNLDIARAAELCHALSDQTRVEIVQLLASGEHCVCELTEALGAAQSRLSFHLKVLKDAGIVSDRREGRWMYYTVHPAALDEMLELLGELKPKRVSRSARCC